MPLSLKIVFPNLLSLRILKSSDLSQLYSISIIYLGNGIITAIYYASTYWNGTAVAAEWGYATFSEKPSPVPTLYSSPPVSSFLYAPSAPYAFTSIIVCWMSEWWKKDRRTKKASQVPEYADITLPLITNGIDDQATLPCLISSINMIHVCFCLIFKVKLWIKLEADSY